MTDRTARWAVSTALALFVAVGAGFSEQGAVLMVVGIGLAAVAAPFLLTTGWRLLVTCTVAGAGVAVLCAGLPANIGWFGLCALGGWCAFRAGVPCWAGRSRSRRPQ